MRRLIIIFQKYYKIVFILSWALIAGGCATTSLEKGVIEINGQKLTVEIAQTDVQQQKGLGGRSIMPENEGMLFLFTNDSQPIFWMKDMEFGLDLIWIKDNQVIEITANVPPPTLASENLALYQPAKPINKVLEVNAGWAKKHEINVGMNINFQKQN